MNFSQLIKTLVDYLDVGKRLATTIPGMVLAFGFVLFFAQAPDVLRLNRLKQDLDAELATLTQLRAEQIGLEQTKEQEQLRDTMAGEVLSGYEKQRTDAVAAYRQKPDSGTEAALKKAQVAYEQTWTTQKRGLSAAFHQADAALKAQDAKIAASSARVQSLEKTRADASGFTGGLTSLFEAVILFGLVGFALGLVLDPVNKALFLQLIPDSAQRRGSFLKSLTGYHLKQPPDSKYARFQVQYFIGRGLITQAEYDELVASYYRFTEITLGMIVPILVLGGGLIKSRQPALSLFWTTGVIVIAVAVAYLMFRVGIRRYGEFKTRVYQLIAGREEMFKDQQRRAEQEAIAVQQAATIRELKDVIRRVKRLDGDGGSRLESDARTRRDRS